MSSFITVSNPDTGETTVIPPFPIADEDYILKVVASPAAKYVGIIAYTSNGRTDTYSAYVRNLTTGNVVRVTGHQRNPDIEPDLVFDCQEKFAVFVDSTPSFLVFNIETGELVKTVVSDRYRTCHFVSACFTPIANRLILAYTEQESTGFLSGKSGLLEVNTTGWSISYNHEIPFIGRDNLTVIHPIRISCSPVLDKVYIPAVNGAGYIYDVTGRNGYFAGYSNAYGKSEEFVFGMLGKVASIKLPDEVTRLVNFPSLEERIQVPTPQELPYPEIVRLQSGSTKRANYFSFTQTMQYPESFNAINYDTSQYLYDPATKVKVCYRPTRVVLENTPVPNRPANVFALYTKLCQLYGLDHTITVPEVLTDDTCVSRPTLVTPLNGLDYVTPAPLYFSVSADGGFGLHLRTSDELPTYNDPIYGAIGFNINRASFRYFAPPFLTVITKPADWDTAITEYREQKSSQVTIAYMKFKEVYGNYTEERELMILFTATGRIDFASGMENVTAFNSRCLVMDDSHRETVSTMVYGGFSEPVTNYEVNWYSNAGNFGITPTDLLL